MSLKPFNVDLSAAVPPGARSAGAPGGSSGPSVGRVGGGLRGGAPGGVADPAVGAESLRAKAYRYLYDEILSGRLSGGDVLSEAAIAGVLGFSRTPVGEAIRQLVGEGLLEQVSRYGTIVRRIGRSEMVEHYELREALEVFAVGKVAGGASRADLDRIAYLTRAMGAMADEARGALSEALDAKQLQRFLAVDMAWHLSIINAAGNRKLSDIVTNSRSILRIFTWMRLRHTGAVVVGAFAHHQRVTDAILLGDVAGACASLLDHIRESKRGSLEHFDLINRNRLGGLVVLPDELQQEMSALERARVRAGGPVEEAPPDTFSVGFEV